MRRFGLIALAAIVTGLVVGIVIASPGDSGSATPSIPELKPPPGSITSEGGTTDQSTSTTDTTTTTTTGTSTSTTPAQTTPSAPSGGAQTPQNDTQQNDQAPPKGSPADKFEQFCKDNPGAC
jgi:hypothetical protein